MEPIRWCISYQTEWFALIFSYQRNSCALSFTSHEFSYNHFQCTLWERACFTAHCSSHNIERYRMIFSTWWTCNMNKTVVLLYYTKILSITVETLHNISPLSPPQILWISAFVRKNNEIVTFTLNPSHRWRQLGGFYYTSPIYLIFFFS